MTDPDQVGTLLAANAATLESMRHLLTTSQQQLEQALQLTTQLRGRTAQAQSPDRMVTVTVDGTGAVTQVSFDRDSFEHHTPMSLANAVTRAARAAVRQLSSNVDEHLESEVPAELSSHSSSRTHSTSAAADLVPSATAAERQQTLVAPPLLSDDPVPVPPPPPPAEPPPAPVVIQDPPPPPPDVPPDRGNSQIDHVMSALSRLPSYTGVVTRVLGVRDPERASRIAGQYPLGAVIEERTFLSTSANPAYTGDGLVRYTIEARHNGKLIGAISQDGEAFGEVVFGPGCRFRVTGKRFYPSIRGWDIALEELP